MMGAVRRGYELRWLFLGRAIRPFHLAVTISTASVGIAGLWFGGIVFEGDGAVVAGTWAVAAAVLLAYGWWFRSEWAAEWGLLLACGVWVARATWGVLHVTVSPTGWFGVAASVAWVVGAGGAYLLERYDNATGGDRGGE